MKHIILIFVLVVFLRDQLTAQESGIINKLGIELSYQNPTVFKEGFFPSLTFSSGKHRVFAGPQLIYDTRAVTPLWGAQAGYRIFPNGLQNRFNLFFDYTFSMVKGNFMDTYRQSYYYGPKLLVKRRTQLMALDNYLGFGFQMRLLKKIYLSTGVAIGAGLYKEEYSYDYENGESYNAQGSLKLRFDGLNALFKFGIGYKFVSEKNKTDKKG